MNIWNRIADRLAQSEPRHKYESSTPPAGFSGLGLPDVKIPMPNIPPSKGTPIAFAPPCEACHSHNEIRKVEEAVASGRLVQRPDGMWEDRWINGMPTDHVPVTTPPVENPMVLRFRNQDEMTLTYHALTTAMHLLEPGRKRQIVMEVAARIRRIYS